LTEVTEVIFCKAQRSFILKGMTTSTPRLVAVVALILGVAWIVVPSRTGAQEATQSTRKVVNRVVPAYPEMARTMNLKGNVRVEVVVGPSGAVKSVAIKGGHPLLAKSAENAVFKWKWESAAGETRELVEMKFNPE